MSSRSIRAVRASAVPSEPVRWLWDGHIPLRGVTLVVGDRGVWKTTWAAWLAASASRGKLSGGEPVDVFFATGEDDVRTVIRPRLEAANADLDRVKLIEGVGGQLSFPDDLERFGREMAKGKPGLVIFDSLAAFVPGFASPRAAGEALEGLTQICREHDCAVVFLHHFTKARDTSRRVTIDAAIGGAGAVTRVARAVHLFGVDPSDDDRRVLAAHKLNVAAMPSSRLYTLAFEDVLHVPAVPALVDQGVTDVTAAELFGVREEGGPEASAVELAEAFLVDTLADGPRLSREVHDEATAAGIADRTLQRARKSVGVVAYEEAGSWWMRLPDLPPPEEWQTA